MKTSPSMLARITTIVSLLAILLQAIPAAAQNRRMYERVIIPSSGSSRTVKPVVMGTHYAVSSMMPQATIAAQRILNSGGNAFDAIVGGQAVLGLVAPPRTASAATPCCWSMTRGRRRSGRSMPRAPHRSSRRSSGIEESATARSRVTIACFRAPFQARSTPGTSCSRAGERSPSVKCWRPPSKLPKVDCADERTGSGDQIHAAWRKYPSSRKVYQPDGKQWREGEIFKNLDLARTLRRLIEAERQAQGRDARQGSKRRATASTRAISRARWRNSPKRMAA